MKTVTLEIALPEWANWIAQDDGGEWFAFEGMPRIVDGVWDYDDKKRDIIAFCEPSDNWKDSLREVE